MITRKSEVPDYHVFSLGTGDGTKTDEFSEHFQRGGGVIFNPKIYIVNFGNFKQGFLNMKLIKKRVISVLGVCFFNNYQ